MAEIWEKVIGFEKYYEVSSNGRIRSFDRFKIDAVYAWNKKALELGFKPEALNKIESWPTSELVK